MKNLLKSILSVAVLCLMTAPAFAFPDVSNDYWAAPQIKLLSEQGLLLLVQGKEQLKKPLG